MNGRAIRLSKLLPEGMMLISVPYDVLPMLTENLNNMKWVLPITGLNEEERKQYSTEVKARIAREYENG